MSNPVDRTFIDPVTINVLIVGDGRLRYDNSDGKKFNDDYSLSLMIEGLKQKSGPLIRLSTTTAYRSPKEHIRKPSDPDGPDSNGEGADIANFKFKCTDLADKYDEVWILGDQSETLKDGKPEIVTTQLTACELCALQEFMDGGGGVFATGDHESLGASINAYVPRVRAMRVWRDGPGTKPDTRYNTLQPTDVNPNGSEADTFPQQIIPTRYKGFVHPLLDGPTGNVDVLPDHIHEGKCLDKISEPDLDDFPGKGNPLPIVVALSNRNQLGPEKRFPAIGAYDGHLAGVGRVVVDASFHHFVKQNLKLYLPKPAANPVSNSANVTAGEANYEKIKTYHQNIAIWLARPKNQRDMFMRALWEVRWRSRVRGRLLMGAVDASKLKPEENADFLFALGSDGMDGLIQLIPRSFALLWAIQTFKHLLGGDVLSSVLYPWLQGNEGLPPPGASVSDDEILAMIGGVMIELAFRFPKPPEKVIDTLPQELESITLEGALIGLKAVNQL